MSGPALVVETCFCGKCGSQGKGTCRMGTGSWSDDSFEKRFGAIIKDQVPEPERHPDVPLACRVGMKARLDLIMLEMLPDEMTVEEMMAVSRAGFDAIMDAWQRWLKAGEL